MADVTGPISSLPGAIKKVPAGTMCDEHQDIIATHRVQGETDSFGSEMFDMCDACYAEHEKQIAELDTSGCCDWCGSHADKRFNRRSLDEGMSGHVYRVCVPCIQKENARAREEDADMDYYD